MVLFATLALLPPCCRFAHYPVVTTGLVKAPRGFGTLVAMFIVGRMMGKVDIRVIIGAGFALTASPRANDRVRSADGRRDDLWSGLSQDWAPVWSTCH